LFVVAGSWHDSRVAAPLYELLLTEVPAPFAIVADAAFPHTDKMEGIILTPFRKDELAKLESRLKHANITKEEYRRAMDRNAQITSARQAAEWGMRSLQGTFSRLKTRLTHDCEKRRRVIQCCLHLYNLRVRRIGLIQTRTVYERYWKDGVIDDPAFDRVDNFYGVASQIGSCAAPAVSRPVRAEPVESKRSGRAVNRRILDDK